MRKLKVYLETTVFNHYFDKDREAHVATVKLFDEIQAGMYEAFTSTYVTDELVKAHEPKRSDMLALIGKYNIAVLVDCRETRRLGEMYINEGIIPVRYGYDGFHIACATINDIDYVFSLNFQHINKVKTKIMTGLINVREGYRPVSIISPMEV